MDPSRKVIYDCHRVGTHAQRQPAPNPAAVLWTLFRLYAVHHNWRQHTERSDLGYAVPVITTNA
jgi:hypothetical protein